MFMFGPLTMLGSKPLPAIPKDYYELHRSKPFGKIIGCFGAARRSTNSYATVIQFSGVTCKLSDGRFRGRDAGWKMDRGRSCFTRWLMRAALTPEETDD